MNVLVLPSFARTITLLGSLLLLTACTHQSAPSDNTAPKVFQYSYKEPARTLVNSNLAQKLSKGKTGDKAIIKLAKGRSSTIRLGEAYFSANGYQCRRYSKESAIALSACKINNHWYQAQPILINQ